MIFPARLSLPGLCPARRDRRRNQPQRSGVAGRVLARGRIFGITLLTGAFFAGMMAAPALNRPAMAAAATPTVTDADVTSYGRIPAADDAYIQLTHNGANVAANYARFTGMFYSTMSRMPGPPGTITSVLNISQESPFDADLYYYASVTITVDTTTGVVTASGLDPDEQILGTGVTLTADGGATAALVTTAFTATTTGDVTDNIILTCLNFSSGVQHCLSIYLQDNTPPVPPVDQAVFSNARDQLIVINYVEAFRRMTEQMSAVMLQQLPIIGVFFDAKHQLESQRLFATKAAVAHKDYHPSEQICAFGTLARSTVTSKYKIQRNVEALNSVLMKRELLNGTVSSAWGPYADMQSRMVQFKATYCDPNDNNRDIAPICESDGSERKNKDIDFRRTLESHLTLNVDFTDGGAATPDEEDIIALAKNLYSHETLASIPESFLVPYGTFREFHDSRMLAAVRGVARFSYATLVAMRAEGSGLSLEQLSRVMENLGVPAADVATLIGENPSYLAQMDIMTQKMFQDPRFMINLYDTPTNVARMGVVLQGIRLMADRDKFEAALRREMLLSMILEMKIRERQDRVANMKR